MMQHCSKMALPYIAMFVVMYEPPCEDLDFREMIFLTISLSVVFYQ